MYLCFTVVTNSYLAHAKSLRESFLIHNPDCDFYIGLLDTPLPDEKREGVVPVTDLNLECLEEMHRRYSPFELSCAMKPYFASYFADKHNPELIIYLDSDIRVYASFDYLKSLKDQYAIFLTPHILNQTPENLFTEQCILRSGIYNAGFFALSRMPESRRFLEWWKAHLRNHCYNKPEEGLFVDQLWLNLVPVLHEKCFIVKNPAYNVAYWNLWERKPNEVVFFHFSGYNISNPEVLSSFSDFSVNFTNFPDFKPFFEDYLKNLELHHYSRYREIKSTWGTLTIKKRKPYLHTVWKAIRGKIIEYYVIRPQL